MSGGNDTNINGKLASTPYPLDLLFLQDAQHLRLQGQAHVSNFIQKQSASIGLFELALPSNGGPSESTLLITKKLAL